VLICKVAFDSNFEVSDFNESAPSQSIFEDAPRAYFLENTSPWTMSLGQRFDPLDQALQQQKKEISATPWRIAAHHQVKRCDSKCNV
jgi:hypothetical protein